MEFTGGYRWSVLSDHENGKRGKAMVPVDIRIDLIEPRVGQATMPSGLKAVGVY